MEGVIPNSKVVIIPATGSDDGMWKKELYLRPGEWIIWVTISVVGAMIILAIIVAVLHLNEKVRSAKFRSSRLFLIFRGSGREKTSLREEGLLTISISTHCNSDTFLAPCVNYSLRILASLNWKNVKGKHLSYIHSPAAFCSIPL